MKTKYAIELINQNKNREITFSSLEGCQPVFIEDEEEAIKTAKEEASSSYNCSYDAVLVNEYEINEDEPLAFMVRQIEFSKSKISMNTKEKNYNNSLEFITDGNEKIEFNFYFNSECSNNYIEVKKGMITIEANKLCEYLKKYD